MCECIIKSGSWVLHAVKVMKAITKSVLHSFYSPSDAATSFSPRFRSALSDCDRHYDSSGHSLSVLLLTIMMERDDGGAVAVSIYGYGNSDQLLNEL